MMTEQVTITTTRGGLEWSFERPPGFNVVGQSAPALVYPWEVAGAGDWKVPVRIAPPSGADDESTEEDDVPPLDLMPPNSVFVWLLMRDARRDNEVEPGSWPPSPPYDYMAPAGAIRAADDASIVTQLAPLTDSDRWGSERWPNLSYWGRIVLLTEADGSAGDEPLYLTVRAFAGPQRSDISAASSLVSSLSYRYVG
jgi:hypothetical protein